MTYLEKAKAVQAAMEAFKPLPEPPKRTPEPWPAECLEAEQRFGQRSARLFPLLGRVVSTPQGRGRLIQVLGETAAVILDSEPECAVFVRVEEVTPYG